MVQDEYHIEMEDITGYQIERSADFAYWEPIAHEELNEVLKDLPNDNLKRFFEVVRNGCAYPLKDYFYRIKSV